MDLENIARVGKQHGRDLAKRVLDRAKREGLTASDMAGLFAEDIVRHSRALQRGDVDDDHIANWVAAVAQGYSERMDEDARKRHVSTTLLLSDFFYRRAQDVAKARTTQELPPPSTTQRCAEGVSTWTARS
jgi:hypothetical protein